jgi:hypothetical protein
MPTIEYRGVDAIATDSSEFRRTALATNYLSGQRPSGAPTAMGVSEALDSHP